jgi:hypothetical protein
VDASSQSLAPASDPARIGPNWARSGEFGTADVEAVADTAMALLDGTGVWMLIHDPVMELDRARALVLAGELGVASGLLASQPER